jgi:membrane-associated phospholipid phosphatase
MLVASRRDLEPVEEPAAPPRRAYYVAPGIAAAMLVLTLAWGSAYGMGIRDPDGIIGWRFSFVLLLVAGFWALDVIPRGLLAARANRTPTWATLVALARDRWPWRRIVFVLGSIVAFYVTYLCYRNVKSYLPLARPKLLDADLANFERGVFGTDPSTLLHQLLGTGVSAQVLSTVYLLFLTFVPISVGAALVWSSDRAGGLWWVTVLSINWVLGVLSYFVLPSMGPAFVEPHLFAGLPETGSSLLQNALMEDRRAFLGDPVGSGELQSIAAFASLHVSIVFAGALVAHLLRAPRALRVAMWVYLALTSAATIYFGWHYVVDDIAGFAIGFASVYLGAVLTGWRIERRAATHRLQLESA